MNQTGDLEMSDAFFVKLQDRVAAHRALHHPFLLRFSQAKLTQQQLATFAMQHYMYSRFFIRNLAAVVSNVPDEAARSMLILNMYEEIGEPLRVRERAHLIALEAGLVTAEQLGVVFGEIVDSGERADIVQTLIQKGLVTREQFMNVLDTHTRATNNF